MTTPSTLRQRADLPGLVNGPVLVLSALLASPAVVRLAQGLLTVTEMLTRYLIITAGCVTLWAVVRGLLQAVIGHPPAGAPDPDDHAITGVVVEAPVAQARQPEPPPLDPDALGMAPEQLIPLTLRTSLPTADGQVS